VNSTRFVATDTDLDVGDRVEALLARTRALEPGQDLRNRPRVSTDPFSDILRLTEAKSVASGGFTAGGAWALRFPPPEKIKFFALAKGRERRRAVCGWRVDRGCVSANRSERRRTRHAGRQR
jgi:hypothetical protein